MSLQLEVIIKKQEKNRKFKYKAICTSFVACKGLGQSKEEAIKNLALSISRHLSKVAAKGIETLLGSEQYSNILLDPQNPNQEEKRTFSLGEISPEKQVSLKLRPMPTSKPSLPKDIRSLFSISDPEDWAYAAGMMDFESSSSKGSEPNVSVWPEPGQILESQGGLVVGIPLSLN